MEHSKTFIVIDESDELRMQSIRRFSMTVFALALAGCTQPHESFNSDSRWDDTHDGFEWSTDPAMYERELALVEQLLLKEMQRERADDGWAYVGVALGRDHKLIDPPPEVIDNLNKSSGGVRTVSAAPKDRWRQHFVRLRRRIQQFSICVDHGVCDSDECRSGETGAVYYDNGTIWKLREEGSSWVTRNEQSPLPIIVSVEPSTSIDTVVMNSDDTPRC